MLNLTCPRCGGPMVRCIALNGAPSEFWYKCCAAPKCNTYFNAFKPLPQQAGVLSDDHKFILNAGGYGSAKTYTTRQLIYKQALINKKATILVAANVSSQYEQTIKKELESDIPKEFVAKVCSQPANQYMELTNGSRILYRPLDDVDKIRSMNLSAFFIIEGSEVKPEAFTQLKSRLRNMAAADFVGFDDMGMPQFENFRGHGVVETNPDSGWVRSEMLEVSDKITQYGTAAVNYKPDVEKADKAIASHISSTDANPYLPKNYIVDLCKNKPKWWVDRYIRGSFEFANGLVYPNWQSCVIPSFQPDKHWVKLIAHDPGLSDPNAFVLAAIDPKEGVVHIYRDKQYEGMDVASLYERYCKELVYDMSPTELYTQPIMDGKMYGRRDRTSMQTLDQMWAQYGVYFQPGYIPVKDRVWRTLTYINSGRLRIHDCCDNLQRELKDYKYKPKSLDKQTRDEPVDKNNHSIDCLTWILMALPEDPKDLMYGAYTGFGTRFGDNKPKEEVERCWQLEDDNIYDDSVFVMEGDY